MSETPGADTLELERELRDGVDGVQGGPWKFQSRIGYVLAPSAKGGDFHLSDRVGLDDDHVQVMRVRGWGYYTGGGHGALGLSPEVAANIQNRTGEHVARCHPDNILRLLDALASLRAEKEELRRERDEARAMLEECAVARDASGFLGTVPECIAHWEACSTTYEARAEAAESLLAEAGKALEPFAKSFDGRRDAHSRRHADRDLGYARFDKMPDEWPIEPAVFSMGAYRRARSVATRIASLTAKEPDNDPVDSDTCIDCMGDGRYPSGATCKSCRGSGHVIAGDGISPKVPR